MTRKVGPAQSTLSGHFDGLVLGGRFDRNRLDVGTGVAKDAVATRGLGAVQGGVGARQQALGVVALGRHGHAAADRQRQRAFDRRPHALGGVTGVVQRRVRHDDDELPCDEETIVLGGIFTVMSTESVTKTPFLGDLPYLGRFFRRSTTSDDKTELLIFITPRLIRDSLTSR